MALRKTPEHPTILDWSDLDGKTLRIQVVTDESDNGVFVRQEITTYGNCVEDGTLYVLNVDSSLIKKTK